uniref:Uncharacterized protein n=1 Tax=Oryza punctata TaxID=4537 RepID=A0A0E0KB92_ORYPU
MACYPIKQAPKHGFAKDVERVDFTETTCHEDYKKLKEIFGKCFTIKTENNVPVYPMYVQHLLNYLEKCPAGILSNQEPLIALLTNHPALACYMDRIKQCILLDNMVHALLSAEKQPLQANLGSLYLWSRDILSVPEMKGRYLHRAKINQKTKRFIVNVEYTESRFGCLHYSRNYFRHAYLTLLNQEEAEAAFAMHLGDFLPSLLEIIALKIARTEFIPPAHFDILKLMRSYLEEICATY